MPETLQAPPEGYDIAPKPERQRLTDPEFLIFQYWFVDQLKMRGEIWAEEYARIMREMFEDDPALWQAVKNSKVPGDESEKPSRRYTDDIYDVVISRLLREKLHDDWHRRDAA